MINQSYSQEEFKGKIDSMYRLVILALRRVNQISKPEVRPLVPTRSKKITITALDEILQGKVTYRIDDTHEEDVDE